MGVWEDIPRNCDDLHLSDDIARGTMSQLRMAIGADSERKEISEERFRPRLKLRGEKSNRAKPWAEKHESGLKWADPVKLIGCAGGGVDMGERGGVLLMLGRESSARIWIPDRQGVSWVVFDGASISLQAVEQERKGEGCRTKATSRRFGSSLMGKQDGGVLNLGS
ncbi:hypothetical protein H103_02082 [Trichophyton rubrum CBS 288.86]|uniref:Uncharacterized protein n=1 Tax=Trichophyton rubrum CBS 288.86 TaxID=1215330 RepID=A0A022WA56_TRIRU|nr:hypothetical protein H102_02072 [Trichophyton rubrum CBS 100081]EZF55247.1 hypothetical protein H103_02082 [Trichophyton rubrum CBS 288.86]